MDVRTARCDGLHAARGRLGFKAGLKLLLLCADPFNRLLMGTRFARATSRELFLASFSFPHSFSVSSAQWFCCFVFFF